MGLNHDLKQKKLFLLDMDGTIYLDHDLFPDTIPFLSYIKSIGGGYKFITNNSSKSVIDYVNKLNNMGIETSKTDFFTSSMASCIYLKQHYPNQLVYVSGTKSLINELIEAGINVTTNMHDPIDVILMGFDTELTFEKLSNLCQLLTQDIPYLATNMDKVCPVSFGFVPDCGSVADMIFNATNKRPYFIGKPSPMMIEYAIASTSFSKSESVVIGDRLYTDILSGINADVTTICVLSGEVKLEEVMVSDIKPDYVLQGIGEVLSKMKE